MKRVYRKIVLVYIPLAALQLATMVFMGNIARAMDVSPPESLTYEIYSSSKAELFWIRSSVIGLSYEIRRDGQLLDTTNGISYLDRTLTKGGSYLYEIVAVDPSGDRSEASTVSFTVGGAKQSDTLSQPSGLRVDVYSSRSVELFWDRSFSLDLTYDVYKDGSLLETTNGVSYYARNLMPDVTYTFQVIAVNVKGSRSLPSSISLTTSGGSTIPPIPIVPPGPTSNTVAAPVGLRASMYSSRSVELFWTRATTVGLTYEILRDGALVGKTDGVSFYHKDLTAGNSYTFQVIAIDAQGNRSTASSIMVGTGGESNPAPSVKTTTAAAIQEPEGFFDTDGYSNVDVVRVDVRTVTTPGICIKGDESGCTLDDVKADVDSEDDFTVDIPIHFQGADLPNDGSINNAELRQRGGYARRAPQKSFRVKLDSKENLWRGERRLQLNKMPYDQSRIRNKLSFDLMRDIPHLPSLRTQFVNLWIDDGNGPEDYGLYTHAEYVGKEYLVNRQRTTDHNIYKAEQFVFDLSELKSLAVDAEGEPLDEDKFESFLEIKSGSDHRKVSEMINAVNDNSRSFDSILEEYFDRDNVLTWVTVNFLLHQMDAVSHNFYLYNPVGSDIFYFLPWDYDGTFYVEEKPANSLDTEELQRRLHYGFSKGRTSNFLDRYYRQPGIYDQIIASAAELRNSYLSDSTVSALANEYSNVISDYASRAPDIEHNPFFSVSKSEVFSEYVSDSHAALIDYDIPLPPELQSIEPADDSITFKWKGAHDMKGHSVSYDLEVSSSPDFSVDDRLLLINNLSENDAAGYNVDVNRIGSGERYARLIARSSSNPNENWQIASNLLMIAGQERVGVMQFTVR